MGSECVGKTKTQLLLIQSVIAEPPERRRLSNLELVFAKQCGGGKRHRSGRLTMQALLYDPKEVKMLPHFTKPFYVVVAYDGMEAGRNAMRVYCHLTTELGLDLQFQNTLISFSLLADPAFAKHAARLASEADMLLIAESGSASPPVTVKHWIESWLFTREPGGAALVGLTGTLPDGDPPQSEFHAYLAKTAEQAGVVYFQGAFPPSQEMDVSLEASTTRSQTLTTLLDDIDNSRREAPRWGINE